MTEQPNVLYAFVCSDEVMYVGKTTKTLRRRMLGYMRPSSTQATNLRNHRNLLELLSRGRECLIFAWADLGLHRFGDFAINFAAALEDSIIATLAPPWNGGRATQSTETPDEANPPDGSPEAQMEALAIEQNEERFLVEVGKTYFNNGFFNVPASCGNLFGSDKALLNIYCGVERTPIPAWINRRSVASGAPRIMGGAALRDWFQRFCSVGQTIEVRVLSTSEIWLDLLSA